MFTDVKMAIDYVTARKNQYLGLNHFKSVISRLNLDLNSLKIIHVAGTNGKGSFVTYLNEFLIASGYNTLSFKSPAMTSYFDRIQYNNVNMDEQVFLKYLNKYRDLIETESLNMFEITFIFALLYALDKEADYVIIEVGIGGRFDCTNIILSPVLAVITSIGMDHMERLGSTIDAIAFEKAGIIKKDCPVLIGHLKEEAKDVIEFQAEMLNSKLYELEAIEIVDSYSYSYKNKIYHLNTSANYQKHNTALVLKALEILDIKLFDNEIDKVFEKTIFVGRFQTIAKSPLTIIDGAHNVDGISELILSTKNIKNKIAIVSILKDKNYQEMMSMLNEEFDKVVFCEFDFYRSLKSAEIVGYECFDNYLSAYNRYRNDFDCVVFCGSLYFISKIIEENQI